MYLILRATVPDQALAQTLADILVEAKLAASVQIIGPIASTYRWRGQVHHASEWACEIRTRAALREQVEQLLRARIPYELPEILALPLDVTDRTLAQWIEDETTGRDQGASQT